MSSTVSLRFGRAGAFTLLLFVFAGAYVLAPYWMIAAETARRGLFVTGLLAAGALWAYSASGSLELRVKRRAWIGLLVLFCVLLLLNYRALRIDIPWRGDEDYHIQVTLHFFESLRRIVARAAWLWALAAGASAIALAVAWRRSRPGFIALAVGLLVLVVAVLAANGSYLPSNILLRYPAAGYWLAAAPLYTSWPFVEPYSLFSEATFRVVPFLAVVGLAWMCQQQLAHKGLEIGILFGVAVGTMPLVYYHASILYLEPPALVLMTYAAFRSETLLVAEPGVVRKSAAWYALIVVGFLKETTAPFLAAFVVARALIRFVPLTRARLHWSYIADEARLAVCVLFPLFVYILFRKYFGDPRGYTPHLQNLIEAGGYAKYGQSFLEQFGPFLVLFLVGVAVLVRRRRHAVAGFLVLSFAAVCLFHLLDSVGFAGLSRFNLFLLPAVLVAAAVLVGELAQARRALTALLLVLVIAFNLVLSPLNLDGSKKPLWGNYGIDTAEHYYPYRTALRWLRDNHPADEIRFAGLSYYYWFAYYFMRLHWQADHDVVQGDNVEGDAQTLAVENALRDAARDGRHLVLYHVRGDTVPEPAEMHGFDVEKVFRNQAHILVLYARRGE